MDKKLVKITDLKKSEFDDFVKSGELKLRDARLIPNIKPGDEFALTSVILSSLRLIKEFRNMILTDANILKSGQLYVFTEIVFPQFPESRVDGLLLIVRGGIIKDAAIFEIKNGLSELQLDQIEKYLKIARLFGIPKLITISNQFVSEPTQNPLNIKSTKYLSFYHFSWSYLLTLAHILLFKNDNNIEDKDQAEIMREVIFYLGYDNTGVCGFNQMKPGWKEVIEKINASKRIKYDDPELLDAVVSWQQEEMDLALILSRKLGVLVSSGEAKYRTNLKARIDDDKRKLLEKKQLVSVLRVKGAVSDIIIKAFFEKRTIEMSVVLQPPQDKKVKDQLNWIKYQLDSCKKKNEATYQKIQNEIIVEIGLKNAAKVERVSVDKLEGIYTDIKNREIREFRILFIKDFGKSFSQCKKFDEIIEEMLINYYSGIVQYLFKWEKPTPKIIGTGEIITEATSEKKETETISNEGVQIN